MIWGFIYIAFLTIATSRGLPVASDDESYQISNNENSTTEEEPIKTTTSSKSALEPLVLPAGCSNDTEVIDERQKGEDNYRVSFDGIRIIVAPPSSLIMGSLLADMKKSGISGPKGQHNKEKGSSTHETNKQKRKLQINLPWLLNNFNIHRKPETNKEEEPISLQQQ